MEIMNNINSDEMNIINIKYCLDITSEIILSISKLQL